MAKRKYKAGPKIYRYDYHDEVGLIRARSKSQAANHLCKLEMHPATASEVAELMTAGISVTDLMKDEDKDDDDE